jgi:hypothetical protein
MGVSQSSKQGNEDYLPHFCVVAQGTDLTEGRMRLVGAGIPSPPAEQLIARWVPGTSAADAQARIEAILGDEFRVTEVVREEIDP